MIANNNSGGHKKSRLELVRKYSKA